jgi:glycosyltransferase involved in cell wall biosynthesis
MPRVQVLLATYNGRAYLPELLDSVFGQRGVDVEVLARDDGSDDGTWDLLADYASRRPLVARAGTHLGVVPGYFWLLERASPTADYIALADQDDVWLPDKLSRAIALLGAPHDTTPAMYCSRLTLVSADLRVLASSEGAPRGPSFENSLVQNIAPGCTIVLNRAAHTELLRGFPRSAAMHDWWIYQVIAGLGRVVYDDESRILYRQHRDNVVGAAHTWLGGVAVRARRLFQRRLRPFRTAQLHELERIHGSRLPAPARAALRRCLDAEHEPRERLQLAFGRDVVFQSAWQQMVFRCLVLLNRG